MSAIADAKPVRRLEAAMEWLLIAETITEIADLRKRALGFR